MEAGIVDPAKVTRSALQNASIRHAPHHRGRRSRYQGRHARCLPWRRRNGMMCQEQIAEAGDTAQ